MATKRTFVEELGAFSEGLEFGVLSEEAREQLKIRILDSVGCCLGAIGAGPVKAVRAQVDEFGGRGHCTLVGGEEAGGTSPDRAAFYNGALLRYLDFMDNYLGKKQSCHPSDNLASVLAASEYADTNGKIFMLALALAYTVQIKLIDLIPVEEKGFDHTVHLAYSMAAGNSKALGLDAMHTAHALAMSGTAFQGLVATRSGYVSQWKGLASAMLAQGVMNTTFLAKRGITGPLEVFEGRGGLLHATGAGKPKLEWSKDDLQLVTRTSVKEYNAEVHSQSAIEGLLELQKANGFSAHEVEEVDVETFKQAYNIIGGGEESGDKYDVHTKEQADHSLPYILAVALLDGEVTPRQYTTERIESTDVQELLKRVKVHTQMQVGKKALEILDTYTARYPEEVPAKVTVRLRNSRELIVEKNDYYGFYSRPMSWEDVVAKFEGLAEGHAQPSLRAEVVEAVHELEKRDVRELTRLLGQAE